MKRLAVLPLLLALSLPAPASPKPATPASWGANIAPELRSRSEGKGATSYIVLLRDRANLMAARLLPERDARRRAIVAELRRTADRSQAGLRSLLAAARAAGAVQEYRPFWLINAIAVRSGPGMLRTIASDPQVQRIVPDQRRTLIRSTPAQTRAAIAAAEPGWNVEKVGAPLAWEAGIDGAGAVVANIDTGVDWEHPSLAAQYRGADGVHDHDWFDAIDGQPVPYDDGDHGTHTMGTMVGGDGLGPQGNDIGVAPGATWIAAKAFDGGGSGADSWILDAAQFLAAPTRVDGTDPRPELAPDVINNSWGGGPCDPFFRDVIDTWRALDIFPAFAIGNSGPEAESASAPGDEPAAVGVGATTIDDEIADFSSRGPSCYDEIKPDLSAPGEGVRSSVPGGGFDEWDGTSMATPHIAGAVALLTQASGGALTVDDAEAALTDSALDLGEPGADNDFGAGRLQAFDAVQIVLQGGTLQGTVTAADGTPIVGASITATGPERTSRAFTRADGTYRLRVVEGGYAVRAEAFGYLPSEGAATVLKDQTTTLDLNLARAPHATVSGAITETPGGQPIAGAEVRALGTPLPPAIADGDGRYAIEVPFGTYELEARAGGCRTTSRASVDVSGPAMRDLSLERLLDTFGHICTEVPFVHEPGTSRVQLSGDDQTRRIDLPFGFPFFGESRAEAWVHTNGLVSFSEQPASYDNGGVPDADEPNDAIYGLWDDLFIGGGGGRGVFTATYGEAPDRRFVLEYRNVRLLWTDDRVDFAIVLFEDGAVEIRYRALEGDGDGREATVGIEDVAGAAGLQYLRDEPLLGNGSAVRFFEGDAGILEGTVTSAADGLPIEGARISAGERTALTRADGVYRLAMFPGTYAVSVEAPGYTPGGAEVAFATGSSQRRDLALAAPRGQLSPATVELTAQDAPVSTELRLESAGQHALEYEVRERGKPAPLAEILQDPEGDAESVDVTSVAAATDDEVTELRITLSDDTDVEEAVGVVHLDTDQNPSTGMPAEEFFGTPEQDVGFEWFLDLWGISYGDVYLVNENFEDFYRIPGRIDGRTLEMQVPLDLIGHDGSMNLSMVLGNWDEPTDWAPDAGHAEVGLTDVPWLSVTPAAGTLDAGEDIPLTVTADAGSLGVGLHRADVVVRSNDPRTPTLVTEISIRVTDATPPSSGFTTANGAVLLRLRGDRITGTATDNRGVGRVLLTFTPIVGAPTFVEADLTCDAAGRACTWAAGLPTLTGPYTVTARATDASGNTQGPAPGITVIVV